MTSTYHGTAMVTAQNEEIKPEEPEGQPSDARKRPVPFQKKRVSKTVYFFIGIIALLSASSILLGLLLKIGTFIHI